VKLRRAAKLTDLLVEEPANPNNRRYLVSLFFLVFQRLFVRRNFYVLIYGVQPRAHPDGSRPILADWLVPDRTRRTLTQRLRLWPADGPRPTIINLILAIPPYLPCNNCK
jgi:hypothetical protein